eukprot:TRINITY_DN24049_c0_g1_i1.p1 TRINITY_DN24049_c0_g1~~TRINITY_DN24049_c0_g1_i1.p1  ORF type:complete len:840 (+),score=135.89 TRINITY_DN24049_c0_g1_i1:248-2767(+)
MPISTFEIPYGLHGGLATWFLPLALLAASVINAYAEVLIINLQNEDPRPLECEAVPANWNQRIDDSGIGAFAGEVHYDRENPGGCHAFHSLAQGQLVLIDAESICDGFATTVSRAAEGKAAGVVFFASIAEPDPIGMALGEDDVPTIRAVMIHRRHGESARDAVTQLADRAANKRVMAELRSGLLISEDAYEEQFIFRVDEFLATRASNFLWHVRPEMLPNSGRIPLSSQIVDKGISPPRDWFTKTQPFVPLFNPSIVGTRDGTLLASLRMSNGPGCPSVRRSKESSMDTRIFRNELVLAHLDSSSLEVLSHVFVEVPPLVCRFDDQTEVGGRKFLDEVSGPMDARIMEGDAGEVWVSFYAERNVPNSNEVSRGMHAAPLHIEWRNCSQSETRSEGTSSTWELHSEDAIFDGADCKWLGFGDGSSSDACQASCDAIAPECNAINYQVGRSCVLRKCSAKAATQPLLGWSARKRLVGRKQWLQLGALGEGSRLSCADLGPFEGFGNGVDLASCQRSCESHHGCDAIAFSAQRYACHLHQCTSGRRQNVHHFRALPPDWEVWQWQTMTSAGRDVLPATCLARAWIEPQELLAFPAYSGVEKNWNFVRASRDQLVVEYHVEPHIVLSVQLNQPPQGGLELQAMGVSTVSRWPFEVLHGLSSVRGGYCCAELREELWRGRLGDDSEAERRELLPRGGPLLLGCGHLQRIRTPFDQAPGDLDRFRRQAKSRTYHNFFYLLRSEPPYDVVAVSTEWCVSMNGHFSRPWRNMLPEGEEACEAIQFASGLALRGGGSADADAAELLVSYGVNDCEADIMVLPLARVLKMLRPVASDTNVSLDDIEMI